MRYDAHLISNLQEKVHSFDESAYQLLLDKIGDAHIVLLGEATHGTHEFYTIRAHITQRLITEKQFNVVAIEGDWPDAYQINRYIQGRAHKNAREAVSFFDRFPTWMWQNTVIVHLVEWLHAYNSSYLNKVHFYGIDLYSLYRSIDTVIAYLEKIDPVIARDARDRYACFDQFSQDPQLYGQAIFSRVAKSCQDEVVAELKRLEGLELQLVQEKKVSEQDAFNIVQNARLIKNAESYYRSLFIDEVSNWNLRDTHMMETLDEVRNYHLKQGNNAKIIVWAHNSHLGNARATQMSIQGELNVGQLVKEKYGAQSYAVGFTTYNGTVSAASGWHAPVERKRIRDAMPGSYEHLFHALAIPTFLLSFEDKTVVPENLLERAIGVIYAPHTERSSHYFYASLAHQFDAVIHCDKTTALEPLQKPQIWVEGEVPETYPSGY